MQYIISYQCTGVEKEQRDPMAILQAQPKSRRDKSQAKKKDNCDNYNKGPAKGWAFILSRN